jgi:hypothetical protein
MTCSHQLIFRSSASVQGCQRPAMATHLDGVRLHCVCTQSPPSFRSTDHHPIPCCPHCLFLLRLCHHCCAAALLPPVYTRQHASSAHAPTRIVSPRTPACQEPHWESTTARLHPQFPRISPSLGIPPTQADLQRLRHTPVKICHRKLPSCSSIYTSASPAQLATALRVSLLLSQTRIVTSSPVRRHSSRRDSAHCPAFQPFRGPRR